MTKYLLRYSFIAALFTTTSLIAQVAVPGRGEVFRDDVIARVDIIMAADSLEDLYLEENVLNNDHYHATFIFNNGS